MKKPTYTVEQIKVAFWKMFHSSGEWFFPYHSEEFIQCNDADVTDQVWEEFKESLDDSKKDLQ